MKSLWILFLCGIWVANSISLAANAERVIKFSYVLPPDTPKGQAIANFAKRVNEQLAGTVRVEIYPNSLLYTDDDILQAIWRSNHDGTNVGLMAAPSLAKFVPFSQRLRIFSLPFLFSSAKSAHKLIDSPLRHDIVQPLDSEGIVPLAFWDNGMQVISTRGSCPLRNPADFAGKRFRIESSDVHAATIDSLGGTPIKLPFKDLYAALRLEIVDGQENTWSNMYSQQLYKVQDSITVSNHSYLGYLVVVNKRFWDDLPTQAKESINDIMEQVTAEERKTAEKANLDARHEIETASQAIVIELQEKQRQDWIAATRGVERQFEHLIGEDLLKEVHEQLDRRNIIRTDDP